MNRSMFKVFFFGILIVGVSTLGIRLFNETKVSVVENCKVIELTQQQLISGSNNNVSTEIRYLVITDKETFICESSIMNGKFNNSDIFFHLKKDSVYNFKVSGMGKTMFTDYRNILEVIR
jgi:hypothetical protein